MEEKQFGWEGIELTKTIGYINSSLEAIEYSIQKASEAFNEYENDKAFRELLRGVTILNVVVKEIWDRMPKEV